MTENTRRKNTGKPGNKGKFDGKGNSAPEAPLAKTAKLSTADTLKASLQAYYAAGRRLELASAKLVAERILAKYPNARYIELEEMDAEVGFIGGEIFSADGDFVGEAEDFDDDEDHDINMPLSNLPQRAPSDWDSTAGRNVVDPAYSWLVFNPNGSEPRIDLSKAEDIKL